MTCDTAREQLLELDVSAFGTVAHLQGCTSCQDFAARIAAAETELVDHVEDFAAGGDFADDWARARATARKRPRWPLWSVATAIAVAALALLVALPASGPAPDPDLIPLPVAGEAPDRPATPGAASAPDRAPPSPMAAPPPPVATPAPPAAPAPAPRPRPRPPRRPAADPHTHPAPALMPAPEADPDPSPGAAEAMEPPVVASPEPTAPEPAGTATLVLTFEAGFASGVVRCSSGFVGELAVGGKARTLRLRRVPEAPCTLVVEPGPVQGTVVGGGHYDVGPGGITPR